jgi:hypothetical protein
MGLEWGGIVSSKVECVWRDTSHSDNYSSGILDSKSAGACAAYWVCNLPRESESHFVLTSVDRGERQWSNWWMNMN